MDLYDRLGPRLYALLHSYEMLWELALVGGERRTARRDAGRLQDRLPFLATYPQVAQRFRTKLRDDYDGYVSSVSPDPIAISLELATFLAAICEFCRPEAILDLGSGFSSYVFRSYQKHTEPKSTVYSIDDSPAWLAKTRRFLEQRELDVRNLLPYDSFAAHAQQRFDLIFQDMSDLATRRQMLDLVVSACKPGGMIVMDDMHVPRHRRATLRDLDRRGLRYFSLRRFTRKRLRYAYAILPA